jgi:hypothetical protein
MGTGPIFHSICYYLFIKRDIYGERVTQSGRAAVVLTPASIDIDPNQWEVETNSRLDFPFDKLGQVSGILADYY